MWTVFLILAVLSAACSSEGIPTALADNALPNCNILTMNPENLRVQVLAIFDGVFVALGTNDVVYTQIDGTRGR